MPWWLTHFFSMFSESLGRFRLFSQRWPFFWEWQWILKSSRSLNLSDVYYLCLFYIYLVFSSLFLFCSVSTILSLRGRDVVSISGTVQNRSSPSQSQRVWITNVDCHPPRHCLYRSCYIVDNDVTSNGPFAKYQLSNGSPLVSMVSINENVKFPLNLVNIQYFWKVWLVVFGE
jgi:hypothetical protein